MSELYVENKQVVAPGTVLAQGLDYLPGVGAHRVGEQILANRVGSVSVDGRAIKLIPLAGTYKTKRDDVIVCKVVDILMSGWKLDTNTAYDAMLSVKEASEEFISRETDLTSIFAIGDYVVVRITNVTSQNLVDVSARGPGLYKLSGGQVLKLSPFRVPRIIGKQGSMVSLIKKATGCNIVVGQNGNVWVKGSPAGEVIAINTIKLIEQYAHVSGLTDAIKAYLEKETAGKDLPQEEEMEEAHPRRPRFGGGRRFDNNNRNGGGYRREGRDGGRPQRRFNNGNRSEGGGYRRRSNNNGGDDQ